MKIAPCLGIPVRFDAKYTGILDSRGLWRWKKIFVGPAFLAFPPREQQALLLHEVGHCKLKHLEKRLRSLWLLFWRPRALAVLCRAQELEADRFAAACGYGAELAEAFRRMKHVDSPLHPHISERIARLTIA